MYWHGMELETRLANPFFCYATVTKVFIHSSISCLSVDPSLSPSDRPGQPTQELDERPHRTCTALPCIYNDPMNNEPL